MASQVPTALAAPTARSVATRAALVSAARDAFCARGYFDCRIADITSRANMAVGSFYNYFATKDDIFRVVACEVIDEVTDALRRDPDNTDGDPRRDIEHALRSYIAACARSARLTSSIQQLSHVDDELRAHRNRRRSEAAERGASFIRSLQDDGRAHSDIDPKATAWALHSMVISVVYDHLVLASDDVDIETLTQTLLRIWVHAIGVDDV